MFSTYRNLNLGLFMGLFFFVSCLAGQIKIGDNPENIEQGSLLELESLNRTLVLTRVSNSQMQSINPLNGALVYNTDASCIYYFDGDDWVNLCGSGSNVQLVENGDRTYTLETGNGAPVTFDGATETVTTIVDNGNGSFVYTNENGDATTITTNASGFSISDNGDGTFLVNDGVNQPFNFFGGPETISTLVDNGNGSYTYTNEIGAVTPITVIPAGSQHFGTPGSIFFANSTNGEPTEDNNQLYWDNVLKRMGIGTTTPRNTLEVNGLIVTNRVSNSAGSENYPGYHFQNSSNTGMWSPIPGHVAFSANGSQVIRVTANQRVGIEQPNPQATLHVGGDLIVDGSITNGAGTTLVSKSSIPLRKNIRRVSANKYIISDFDDTLILESSVNRVVIPSANFENIGRLLIIKNLGDDTSLSQVYRNQNNIEVSSIFANSTLWLQSDGVEWQQIN